MKELQYPFNGEDILKRKKSLLKQLRENGKSGGREGNPCLVVKIAILGGSTTSNIRHLLELFLLQHGIDPVFYESEYAQYYQDAMFPNSEMEAFQPDLFYIHISNRNITQYPELTDDAKQVDRLLDGEYQRFSAMWDRLAEKYHCPVIQTNFEYPYYRLLGNKDATDIHGKVNFVTRLNARFYEYAQTHDNFYILDINYLSSYYGLEAWSDPFYWHMYKYALCVPAMPLLAHNIANIIKSIYGKNKKGFVLDLDNTLWGGIVGDDGPENLVLGPEVSMGQVYSEFQGYLKEHQQLGVVLNINSKNDYENAIAGLNHPDSKLKPEDFICIKANWEPKSQNMLAIAEELKLLPESLVFVDDNPVERVIVRSQVPGAVVPEIEKVEHYAKVLDQSGFFEATQISQDDTKRNEMYKENAKRAQIQASFASYEDFLLSLNMKAVIRPFEPMLMARIAQLTNKSNQFNLTTLRCTQTEIEAFTQDDRYLTLYGKLEDSFGDNGVVSVVIGRLEKDVCHIDLWLMSCRVLKRDMEFAMMDALVKHCVKRGVTTLLGYYYPTAKNSMVKEFYAKQGFDKESEDENGNAVWRLSIEGGYTNQNKVIQVEE